MYQYDEYDQKMVETRVAEFRDQVERRLSGDLTEDQFTPLRLMNGLYLQLHAYMLRVAVPYGTLSAAQMRMLAQIARKYDKGYGHFTTRQNIQYNWIQLKDAPDILADLATVEMHAIQTSGNCIRNISSDQFAGVAKDEVCDPRPYAELLRQWSSFHPEFSYLPRKFKFAVIASAEDRAAMRLHDIGIEMVRNDADELGAKFFAGGGMGRTPMIGPCVREFVPADALISYSEAILRVYNRYGRRDNKYKARIKILVHELGIEEFRRQVEAEFAHMHPLDLDPPRAELTRIQAFFAPPAYEPLPDGFDDSDPDFKLWADANLHPHKVPGYAAATISLKPVGGIPGDASAEQMDLIADLAARYSMDEVRVTHAQNLVLPNVRQADLYALWQELDAAGLAPANLDLASDIIACPGLDYCSLANARSIPIAQKLAQRLAPVERDLGELKIKISGCINACGHHHAGHIGILGVDRKGVENYQLLLGGSGAEDVSLAKITGPGFDENGIVDAVETVTNLYRKRREDGERFVDTYRRLGMDPFKEALYG
ncbi:nitrite/sulfite reductase [Pacificimonas flava]|uniref:Sulfite reductase [NADPH] hemoprotein beta-component n=1 Tax=Pacificimonas flava TaxID=1234595 RepID=M2U215_9SPHN|nr:nitrite/sulfite reductase [Pacificimonas flava]EMD82037.1 Sulfite reductase [NADPH] hemoprotein beta-component [Pacificimonas flava]MBB5280878.1 sulfite reductase (NADPH) hemoprotein beta-component [Pacificimonas flava]